MLVEHAGKRPQIDLTAWIAPDATICGDMTIGPCSRVLYGARIIGESGGRIRIGRYCIVMENAVVRGTFRDACSIGDYCFIGPSAHVTGCRVGRRSLCCDQRRDLSWRAFGTGQRGARAWHRASTQSFGARRDGASRMVAVADPACIFSPDRHDEIWAIQEPLDFPQWVYGFDRSAPDLMRHVTRRLSEKLGGHADDIVLEP